jgi:hypothetical protein
MGHKALSKVQMGAEATAGTAVAADFIWRGPFGGLKDARETEPIEEDLGVAMKSSRKFSSMLLAELSMPATALTPEQAPHIFEAGIKAVGTGVADGTTSSGYVYSYPFGLTSINTIKTYTIETGDESQAEEAEYCFVESFTITAAQGQVLEISADWKGRQVANTSFTGALSAPAVTEIAGVNGTVYIDEPSGTIGTTQVSSGNLMELTLSVNTGRVPLFTADSGELYFVGEYFNIDAFEATLEMKWIHDAAAVAEKAKWQAGTNRLVRIEFTGEAYGSVGTGTDLNGFNGIRIDFPGSYDEFSAIEHEDGKSVVTATLSGGYENESGEVLTINVYNELTALP